MQQGKDAEELVQRHLGWTDQQKRILTACNRADDLYTAFRGFPFEETELPHYHLMRGDTHAIFEEWKNGNPIQEQEQDITGAGNNKRARQEEENDLPIAGAWTRLIFVGGWEHTSSKDERTFNLQTSNLFIDLRIPQTRELLLLAAKNKTSLKDLSKEELRYYARQHVFAGYTKMTKITSTSNNNNNQEENLVCTRHHCMDWNFVGAPRSRPNKWYAELQPPESTRWGTDPVKTWKEWAFATDERGQHYYMEQWERLPNGNAKYMVALRLKHQPSKENNKDKSSSSMERDGILLIVGDHFSYILGRDLSSVAIDKQQELCQKHSTLVGIVDAALNDNDLTTAMAYLSIQAGHGRIADGWIIDCAIEPWREGTPLWTQHDSLAVTGNDVQSDGYLQWNDQTWEVFDTTLSSIDELKCLLRAENPQQPKPVFMSATKWARQMYHSKI